MLRRLFLHRAYTLAMLAALLAPSLAWAGCEQKTARLVSLQGVLEVQGSEPDEWKPVTPEEEFCPGDRIRTRSQSRATIELNNKTYISLNQQTTIVFSGVKPKSPSWLDLLKGIIYVRSRTPSSLDVRTRYINAAIRGTEFLVSADETQAQVSVIEGAVDSSNDKGSVQLTDGQAAVAKAGEAPVRKLLIAPRDAVRWALYYPPVIDLHSLQRQSSDPAVKQATARYLEGDSLGALAALDGEEHSEAVLRAGLLIGLGRVEEAQPLLDGLDVSDPRIAAESLALRSIIALAANDKAKALEFAQQATTRQPQSPVAWTALSYVRQAEFELDAALQAARKAAKLDPDNGLARAREAELLAALGRRREAKEAASAAATLNPRLSRVWAVQGFAQLNQMDYGEAARSFRKAIDLDSADPLPRFGLGLAKIRAGDLDSGTADLEISANLDPNDALTRSYLGKAYYEQKNSKIAGTEFETAKQLDPNDPTPWFYGAIKKQTENREVEAVQDMRKAIELNDNRGVYRSKQMLDDDLAARGSALGRIYNQVGFQRLGQLQAFDSLASNPANYTAHRLLSDTYLNVPRHESARVSELLQAQMLQPINITPLQPQQAESNLLTVSGLGPANPSMNEFNPLFARNQVSLLPSAMAGSFNTFGNETVLSGIYDRLSGSLGQMHMSTQGFRNNNDIDENLYTAFLQGQARPDLSFQGEYRHRDIENGFLPLHFDPTAIQLAEQNTYRRKETSDIYRFGAHWSPGLSSDVLASFAFQDAQENIGFTLPGLQSNISLVRRIYSGEIQYIYRHSFFDAVAGGGHVETNGHQDNRMGVDTLLLLPIPGATPIPIHQTLFSTLGQNRMQSNGYVYFNPHYPDRFNWTLGLSGDSLKVDALNFDVTQINPKLGVTLQVTPATALRLAYFRTLRQSMIGEQTLQPVQIAGFNQFYDDRVATTATRYGVALDHHINKDWSSGFELSQRDLNVPSLIQGAINQTGSYFWREQLFRYYLYWTPTDRISARLDYSYEDFSNKDYIVNLNPPSTRTHTVPLAVSYFDPSGWFATVKTTYVNQQANTDGHSYQEDKFTLVDTSLGYRLPKRWGIIQLDIRNLLDQKFRYQSYDLRTQAVEQAPFFPERAVYGRITLSF